MSDLILDLVEQRASGIRSGNTIEANELPDQVIYTSEIAYFSHIEVDVIGVEFFDGEVGEYGGYNSVREALSEGCDCAYFHIKGRSKRDVDADSPWYPLHDTRDEETAYALAEKLEHYIRSALSEVA